MAKLILMLGSAWPPVIIKEPMPVAYCAIAGKQWVTKHEYIAIAKGNYVCLTVGK